MVLNFLTIGDLHFKTNNIAQLAEATEKILDIVDQHPELDFVVVLGDVHDKFQYIHSQLLTNVSKFFNKLKAKKPLYVLVGNHDRCNNSDFLSDVHPFNDFKGQENIYIADHVLDYTIKGHRLLFVPYVPPGRFMEALETVENPLNCDLIFAHQEFYGVHMGAIVSTKGDKWEIFYPWVITGHIHDYNFNKHNIIYVGTPIQHNYNESPNKTISMFLLKDEYKENKFEEGAEKDNLNQSEIKDNLNNNNNKLKDLIETRIKLGTKLRETIRVAYDKLALFIPNPDKYQKVIICGTDAQIKAIKLTDIYVKLKKEVEKVDFEYLTENMEIKEGVDEGENLEEERKLVRSGGIDFLVNLYNRSLQDARRVRVFEEIFGKISEECLMGSG